MKSIETPRILLLDFYDSFTHNLAALLRHSTGALVDVVSHDHYSAVTELEGDLASYHALVIGPGPGSPEDVRDIGVAMELWTCLSESSQLPILGVCLGLQSLCIAFGGQLKRLAVVKHGIISEVTHVGRDIFAGVEKVAAVRYHSLHVDMSGNNDEIEELAWTADEGENGRVLMAARHRRKPYWAVQYHPESICTEGGGQSVVQNWWQLAQQWNKARGRGIRNSTFESRKLWSRPGSLLEQAVQRENNSDAMKDILASDNTKVHYTTIIAPQLASTQICELLGSADQNNDFAFLDSAASPGRYSIIGVLSEESTQLLRFHALDGYVEESTLGKSPRKFHRIAFGREGHSSGDIWEYLAKFMAKRQVAKDRGPTESPFWGGVIGYINYETGVQSLDIPLNPRHARRADIQLVYVERSIVVDTWSGAIYIQTLREQDDEWLDSTKIKLQLAADMAMTPSPTPPLNASALWGQILSSPSDLAEALSKASKPPGTVNVIRPQKERYINNIRQCQQYLAEGHSYELCLTALTKIHLPLPSPTPWTLFTNLRSRNPAPYSAYLRLPDVTIVSSSPERFLSWNREGVCQLRPIKGTVKRTTTTTLEYAKSILHAQKEMAENLMIVDLIRHDLNQVAHEGSVKVRKLMQVEEYKSVYQLVSVIEGTVGKVADEGNSSSAIPPTGFDVLARSLPPGSMTGAPKKRSVELLQSMEGEERGIYSGVMGYWSVCGAGDWSVIIRTAFRYDDENDITRPNAGNATVAKESEVWRIGAGGAITALSDPEGEWDEMEVKLESTLRAFIR
ncbi:ADC synthase [Terfezia claveryi]|nr:ADC synthase [Terfezia claveryi]